MGFGPCRAWTSWFKVSERGLGLAGCCGVLGRVVEEGIMRAVTGTTTGFEYHSTTEVTHLHKAPTS